MSRETIKVRTQARLHRGALLEIDRVTIRRVVREGASVWRKGEGFTTEVEVEPALVQVGDYTHDAELV